MGLNKADNEEIRSIKNCNEEAATRAEWKY